MALRKALVVALILCTALGSLAAGWLGGTQSDAQVWSPGLRSTKVGVYRPGTTEFIGRGGRLGFKDDPATGFLFTYGTGGDIPVIGDWDGNGSQTYGVFRAGMWYLSNKLGGRVADLTRSYGNVGDRPIVGDWNGDGIQTIGVHRGNQFFLSDSNASPLATYSFAYGDPGDTPIVGDWDNDGLDTIGTYRSGTWHLRNSNSAGAEDLAVTFGSAKDVPVVGDWDSDGRIGIGYFQAGDWHLSNSLTEPITDIHAFWGAAGQQPLVGNWGPTSQLFGNTPPSLANLFPIAADYQPPSLFSTWKGRGINTVIRVPVGTDIEAWTRTANALGLKMIREPRSNPALDDAEPNLLALAGPDEPELTPTVDVHAQYSNLKASAPSKPYLLNFAGQSVLYETAPRDPLACNGPGDSIGDTDCITRYIGATDWVSSDIYPVNSDLPIESVGSTLDRLRRWSARRPQFAYIEASDYDNDDRYPSRGEFRAEIWDAVIHGARGISYFVVDATQPTGRPDAVPADIVAEMQAQNARLTQLASVLQSPINPPAVGIKARVPIEYTWRQLGSSTYVIALNQSPEAVGNAAIKVLGPTLPATVGVWRESRAVPAVANSFTDSFGPYEVHVYQF
jgi:hypothetical protein